MHNKQSGQTLLEIIVVIAVGVTVVGAIVFAAIASLRNAQFANNQARSTALAQEGLEKTRSLRDRDGSVIFTNGQGTTAKFSDLWAIQFSCNISINNCYFTFNVSGNLVGQNSTTFESLGNGFNRQIQIEDGNNGSIQKKITSIVTWTDYSGTHISRLTTTLRKL